MPKSEFIQWKTHCGEPIQVGELSITLQSQSLTVRSPSRWPGGFVWNRPTGVLVERDGVTERIPIVDVTRMAQVGLVGLAFLAFIFVLVRLLIQGGNNEG
ncbi:MAG: hypothetical protein JXA42_17590 [Anaerolineales bacterium]|nr:hypothetical protein [Anaerolineales bacterium]